MQILLVLNCLLLYIVSLAFFLRYPVMNVKVTKGLRAVALFEAAKGLFCLIIAVGLYELAGQDLHQIASTLLGSLHFNPAGGIYRTLLHEASLLSTQNLRLILLGLLVYAAVRFIEAYGLWHAFVWTKWFALLSGAIYLPFEVYQLMTQQNLVSGGVLLINLLIVIYLWRLLQSRRKLQV